MTGLGRRYKCYKCDTKFYDLGKPQPVCPSCGEDQNNRDAGQLHRRRKRRWPSRTSPDVHPVTEEGGTAAGPDEGDMPADTGEDAKDRDGFEDRDGDDRHETSQEDDA